ncbi:pyridoxamine 5'-phosphate oxidase family protein [Allonocardiopsis opalescens]|uniref:Pyridoxamine 5'-phosphate oxidase n=1 Tax=Allonocardiopsis opalescens TaxID=1144618 RepID=A0A2T0Q4Y9_9ACTN|nr:pyridoxamine 5'-phosphate oxidase family protein [Allonocardiopsis opalescens]PRX98876.1 pyridoxamine 5'-phosphate oxidase [Allonocardiopsis opalescens]
MTSWHEFERAAPELAGTARARFDAFGGLALVATLRRDGSPRISGIEVTFAGGELWIGMMPGSRKAEDLRRDPRLALHSASSDPKIPDGDAKLSGLGVPVEPGEAWREYAALMKDAIEHPVDEWFPAFRVDLREASTVRVAGDRLVIDVWKEGEAPRRIERR